MSGVRNRQLHQGLPVITKHIIMARMTIHRIRLSKMQKVVNVLAVASAAVSLAVVGTAGYVFVNKDAIIKDVTDKAMESVLGGGLGGGSGIAPTLPLGTNDLADPAPAQAGPAPAEAPTALSL